MVLVATRDEQLAEQIGESINGPRAYVTRVSSPTELRHKIHSSQPSVVFLDVRLGGSTWRAVEAVAGLASVRSRPAVVLLAPWASDAVDAEAARLGCYDVLDASAPSFCQDVQDLVE